MPLRYKEQMLLGLESSCKMSSILVEQARTRKRSKVRLCSYAHKLPLCIIRRAPMMHTEWKKTPNILLTTPTKLHSAEKRFNWRSLHLQPQAPRGLLLALILLRNVLLTSCLAENQLTSAAIAECRKTSGRSPRHLICSWTDRNYTPLVDQCDFLFIYFLFQGIQKMFSWPSHPDELTLLVFPIALLSLEIPPNASHCHLSSPPCSSFVLFCVTLETWTEGLRGKGVRRKRQLKSHPQTNVSFT